MVKKLFNLLGYDIRRQEIRGWNAPFLAQLSQPKTVFDVGAGYGTPELYKAFPNAQLFLIEPLKNYEDKLKKITQDYNCKIIFKALGAKEDTQDIFIDTGSLTKSSFYHRTELTQTGNNLQKRRIDITTLDKILESFNGIKPPVLLKIDTEGHDLDVIKGATEFLKITDIVIAEVSVAHRFHNGYSFEEFTDVMRKNGFRLFDFLTINYIFNQPGIRFIDAVFKKDR